MSWRAVRVTVEEFQGLQQQLTEAQARIARLESVIQKSYYERDDSSFDWESLDREIEKMLKESPRQSLDHIIREAQEAMRDASAKHLWKIVEAQAALEIERLPLPIDKEEKDGDN